jgi:hypothetical protein
LHHLDIPIPPPPPSLGTATNPLTPDIPAAPISTTPARKELHHYPQVKLKNLQWQKLDVKKTNQTLWDTENSNLHQKLEERLKEKGIFNTIESLFPAKENKFLEKRLQIKKIDVDNDLVKFLTKDKNRNISK